MGNGARYKVQTQYGWFSLDEGSYRDFLKGKLWISWSPQKAEAPISDQDELPPEVSDEAVRLRDEASQKGFLCVFQQFGEKPVFPWNDRMRDISIEELNISVRSSNGLMRAGAGTFGRVANLMEQEGGIGKVRNLGIKSVKEIRQAFYSECYNRLIPYEKALFWQKVIEKNT